MVEVKPINISLDQHCPGISVRTAISPTLTEEFIIHPSVYSQIEKLGHAKSDVLLNESESSLGAHAYAYPNAVSFSNVPVSILCKKANGAMKTSSLEFISRSPTPSPMNSNYRRFVLLRRIFQPLAVETKEKRNRFEQTSRTLQRKISMRSTKDQLVKKDVLMPVKHNVFLWNLPDVEEMPSHDGETV
ncbi:phosphatase and actin regulator 2 [Trichonephila clavipes]|uniref:Phosphatase and actin regulator 2 n=1 Tax=Trichonephila clavipes TaxID=2585209 RepID=A0A8X6W234_TRICX|nr:phosphatase and actin regulator 2 [Trichonephila clavipes]